MSGFLTQLSPEVRRQVIDLLAQVGIERGRIDEILSGSSTVDHGALIGLGDNDHPQYALLTALNDEATLRANQDTVLQNNIDLKAPINDPVFTGIITVTDEVTFPPGPGIKMRLASGGVGADYWIGIDNPLTFHLNTAFNGKFQFTQDTGLVDLMDIDEFGVEVFVAPTLPQHLTRKDYVDAGDIVNLSYDTVTRTVSSDTGGTNAVISQASSAFPAFWGLQSGANAKLAEDAAPQVELDAHINAVSGAHAASAISYDYGGVSAVIEAWLGTATNVDEALSLTAAQLYTPDEDTIKAMIEAANALVIADPDAPGIDDVQFNNADIFASNVIVARHILAGSINAAKIDAESVRTAVLTAGSVGAEQLLVSTQAASNLVYNPMFEGDLDGWIHGTGASYVVSTDDAFYGAKSLKNTGAALRLGSKLFPVDENELYIPECRIKVVGATTGDVRFRMYWYDADEVLIGFVNAPVGENDLAVLSDTGWQHMVAGYPAVPLAGAKFCSVVLHIYNNADGTHYFDGVVCREQVTETLIRDGAITTDKMTANTIDGDRITAGTLNADKIIAGSITTSELALDAIKSVAPNAYSYTSGPYSDVGSLFDLATGDIITTSFSVIGGNVSVKGDVEADTFILNQAGVERSRFFTAPTSLWADDAGFSFEHPASVAARTRGVAGDAGTSFGIDDAIGDFNQLAMRATAWSELTGGDDYQTADAAFTLKTNINTGIAIAQITAGGELSLPTGSGANVENSITVYGYGEGGSGNFGTYISGPLDVDSNTTIGSTGTPVTLTHSGPFKSQSSTFADFNVHRTTTNTYSMIQYSNGSGDLGKAGFNNSSQFAIRTGAAGSDELTFTGSSIRVPGGGIETKYNDANQYVNVGASIGAYTSWKGIEGKNGVILMSNASAGHIYIRNKSTANIVYLGVGTSNKFQVWNAGAKATGWLEATGRIQSLYTGVTTSWDSANLMANPSSGNAVMSFHPGGIALQLRVGYNVGTMYVRNSVDSGTYTVYAYHAVPSSGEWKHDVQTWGKGAKAKRLGKLRPDTNITGNNRPVDDPDIPSPLEAVKKLRTVAYRLDKTEQLDRVPPEKSRQDALSRLNEMRRNQGLGPFQSEETIHLCGRDCDGTPEDPCVYVKDWEKGRVGFISEELAEVLPEAVRCDPISGKWNGIDTLAVTAAAVGAIQEQQEIIDGLLARIEALEAAL